MESLFHKYQQISNNITNTNIENNNADTLETTISNSALLTTRLVNYSESQQPQSQGTLFIPFLGQSNARNMSIVYPSYQPDSTHNHTSGALVLEQDLSNLTGSNVVTNDAVENNFAVGGSKVNGNGYFIGDDLSWWYPQINQPGGALRQAEQGLRQWLSDNGAQPTDEIAIVWSQGESDVGDIYAGNPATKEAYKQSTIAVFDYLKNNLGYENITFYLVPTGRLQEQGAANKGLSSQEIDFMNQSLEAIRNAQSEIAIERDDVRLAPNYADLNMIYEEGEIYGESYDISYDEWSKDFWHLGHDGLQVHGNRLAQYIALDRGHNNVISFTDSFGNPAQSISLTRDGILDLNRTQSSSSGAISGTNNPDVIVGSLSADAIAGGNGNDVIVGTQGTDTLTGGNGNDVFFYIDGATQGDLISDFQVGNDRLDLSEPLRLAGYSGANPIADGYVVANSLNGNTVEIQFDADGTGEQPANTLAVLENINSVELQNQLGDRFIFTPTEF